MQKILPPRLKQGDTIGVFTLSDPIVEPVATYVRSGIEHLEELGFKVRSGKTLSGRHYYTTGTPQERWQDLRSLIEDPEVTMIMTAMGGQSAHEILPLVDFDLIRKNPKIYMGYSDPTVLLNPITNYTGLVTFYGFHASSFDYNWEWFSEEYDLEHFRRIVMGEEQPPITVRPYLERQSWRAGEVEGVLAGGCLGDLVKIVGTPYEPNWEGRLLLLEQIGCSPKQIAVYLEQLKQAGVFDKVNGLVLGKFYNCRDDEDPDNNRPLEDIFVEKTADLPILKTEDFGHFSHIAPLPIGCPAYINTTDKNLQIIEQCVS